MEIHRWSLLITVFMAVAHCLALVNQEDSDLTNPSPRTAWDGPQFSESNVGFAFSLYRHLALGALDRTLPSPQ